MTEERLLQVRNLFEAALEQSPRSRLDFLQEACVGDDELFREVQVLVNGHEQSRGLLDLLPETADASPAFFGSLNLEGRRIGPYSICEEIGRGGMGVVYSALRADGAFNKKFALKVVQYAVASEGIVARFRQEREILGRLDHPNIARLIDAGATDEGLPFYVMEYIEGQPLDSYCDERRLNVTQRIELFRSVCQAVQYAHQNLVVHRDLKPSNILVTSDGTVKLLDFGIAKVLDQSGALAPLDATLTGMRVMTPEYASPEQIKGEPITTATDIYTLGVILYELLTGQRPYHLRNRLLHEIERVICEEEPTHPSTAVDEAQTDAVNTNNSSAAEKSATREGTIAKLKKRLSGDIDNILLFALRKEPSRRYSSAEQFEADLRRHLDGLPVFARKGTLGYRAQKFLSRHRLPITAAAAFFLLLTGGLLTTLHLYSSAKAAQASAEAGLIFAWAGESLKDDPERALILGLYAWGKQRAMVPGLEQFLHDTLLESRARLVFRAPGESPLGPNSVNSIAWSPDGGRLATGTLDGTARIWDERAGRELITLRAGFYSVDSLAWSPDGNKLATTTEINSTADGKSVEFGGADIWDVRTGRKLLSLPVRQKALAYVAWSPDGSKLAAANGNTIVLWDAATGRELLTLDGHEDNVRSVAWSPAGNMLATATEGELLPDQIHRAGGHTKIWDTGTGRELRTLLGHGAPVVWSPDGTKLATASEGYLVKIWEVATARDLLTLQHQFTVKSLAWSLDGSKLATVTLGANQDLGATKVWELATARDLFTLPASGSLVDCVAWSPDSSQLATGSEDGTAKIWTTGASEDLRALRGHRFPVESIDWSPDGSKLASGSEDGVVKIWQPTTGRELLSSASHQDSVNTVAWSPDGNRLATASPDGTVNVYKADLMQNPLTLRHQFSVVDIAWSPDGGQLATASAGRALNLKKKFDSGSALKIWDSTLGRELLTAPGDQRLTGLAWSAANQQLATDLSYGSSKIWQAATGSNPVIGLLDATSTPHTMVISRWSQDGSKLATGLLDGTVKIWETVSGRELLTLGPTGDRLLVKVGNKEKTPADATLLSLAWSPDGRKLAATSEDGATKIWDTSKGDLLLKLHGHKPSVVGELGTDYGKSLLVSGVSGNGARNNVNSVAWSPDSKLLASAGDDGIVQVYAIEEGELLHLVRSRVTRNLTPDECKRYLNLAQCPSMPALPEPSPWHRTPAKLTGYQSTIKSPYTTVLEVIAVIGTMILLLKLGESILEPDQKRLLSKTADALLLHLSKLHPVRSLRFLHTVRGRWVLPLLSASVISALAWQRGHGSNRLLILFAFLLVMAVLTVVNYIPFFVKLSGHIFSYCTGPLGPYFEGIEGRDHTMLARAITEIWAFGVACSFAGICSLLLAQAEMAKHGALYGLIPLLLALVFVLYSTLFSLLLLTFGATFACELLLRPLLAVARRIVRDRGRVSRTPVRTW